MEMRYNVKIVTYNHDFVKRKVIKVAYLKEIEVSVNGVLSVLYVTDDPETGERLQGEDKPVIIYIHEGNRGQDFSGFLFAVEDPEDLEPEYVERVYRRLRGLPWNILETPRCLIRETTEEDVEDFYQIYSHPDITRYMENLYPEIEQENIGEDLPVSSVQTVRKPQTPRMQHQPMVKKPTDPPRKENKREDRTPIRLSTKEEARRAFIYSEIFNRKY